MIIITQARARIHIQNHTNSYIHTHIHTERERGGEKERRGERELLYFWTKCILIFNYLTENLDRGYENALNQTKDLPQLSEVYVVLRKLNTAKKEITVIEPPTKRCKRKISRSKVILSQL